VTKKFCLPNIGYLDENANFEIRMNAFNVFNRLNLNSFSYFDSGTFVNRANFGEPSGAGAGRTIEFQARLRF
jgi:hypothetical protein